MADQKVAMDDVVGLVVCLVRTSITRAGKLKIVAKYGAGFDNIDVAAANDSGVYVAVAGDANAEAVAEMALSLLLALSRNIPLADKQLRAGKWMRYPGHELYGKTVGVIGLGSIGQAFVKRISVFDVSILGNDPFWNSKFADEYQVKQSEINDIFAQADFISLHCPLTPETKGLVNKERLALMKPEAYIVNTSRGPVVNEQDLYHALVEKRIAGAALDVFTKEPLEKSPLFELDNIVLTSHMGAYTIEAFARMDERTVGNIEAVLAGKTNEFIINLKGAKNDE